MADEEYSIKLNISDILAGLVKVDKATLDTARRIESHFKKAGKSIDGLFIDMNGRVREANGRFSAMGNAAANGFKSVEDSAKLSGVQIGITAGIAQELTRRIIDLGQRAIAAFAGMTKESVELASSLETTQAIFTGIFQGNEQAAVGALQHIRKESRELGIDLTETSRAFLPFVASLEELSRVNRLSAALAISQPEQGELGARIALQEALSGNVASLVRRFEIPKTLGKELQRALDEGGVAAFLDTFETIMKRLGRDVENLTDTFQFSFGRAAESGRQLQAAFGVPILDALKEQFDELNDIIETNFDDYTVIADAFGRVIANIVDLIGGGLTEFLEGLDTDQVTTIAEKLFDISEDARLFVEQLGLAEFPQNLLDGIDSFATKLDQALTTLNQIALLAKAELSRQRAEASVSVGIDSEELKKRFESGEMTFTEFLKAVADVNASVLGLTDTEAAAAAGQKAYDDTIKEGLAAFEESNRRKEENRQKTEDLKDSLDQETDSTKKLTDAQLALNKATADLEQLNDDYADAQAKVNEKITEAEQDFQQKLQDIDIQTERKRLDIIIEFAQKREDAARNNLQKLEDIQRGYAQDVEDAATDLARKEEDIARKHGQDRIDLERENRQKRVDIERNYRQTVQDIQRQFLIDADEAEQKRDAVAFLRALKDRNNKLQEAQINRQREIQEQQVTNQRKTEELRIQQEREIEEARLANERKLEDLRTNLDRQIEAQNIAYGRQLEEIAIGEQRKNEELALARQRDIEDAKLAYERKLEDLRVALEAELALIEEYAARRAALEAQIAANVPHSRTYNPDYGNAVVPPGRSRGPGGRPASTPLGSVPAGTSRQPIRRQHGGSVAGGASYLVGERGPELFVPASSGAIVPNSAFVGNAFTPGQAVQNISNVKGGNTINVPDVGGLLNNPTAVRMVENIVMRVLGAT